ncbi:N-acetylglucosamine-6-phosphate deacetylase [soil metagenome]
MSVENGFFDLQVNGFGGVDFNNDDLTAERMNLSCRIMRDDGVTGFLATIVTEELPVMLRRIKRMVELRKQDPLVKEMVVGLHVEGPFINPQKGYVGAHPPDAVIPATRAAAEQLVDACDGLMKILTLAPEQDAGLTVTRWIADQKIVVAAGHTNADYNTLSAAADAGLSMFTHLGNGCPMEIPRHDNIVQRALSMAGKIRFGLIADGVHVALFALKNYLAVAGIENCFIVSDAISAAGLGPGTYRMGRREIAVGEDKVVRSPDGTHLVGSAITLKASAKILETLGFSQSQIEQLTIHNPRKFIGL